MRAYVRILAYYYELSTLIKAAKNQVCQQSVLVVSETAL